MQVKYIKKTLTYTGRELSSLFAYKNFGLQGDSIVAFCGPAEVATADLVDQADVRARAFIYSPAMVHFIAESFNLNLPENVYRQRLYMAAIKETLETLQPKGRYLRRGDDIFVKNKKLSVSIATLSPVSALIHIGINIDAAGAPVPAIGLRDLGIAPGLFIPAVLKKLAAEEQEIALARCKVRGVQ